MTTLSFWVGILITVAVTLVTIEGSEAFAWFAVKLIHRAARQMPSPELRERYDEEWLAELAAYDGLKIAKFIKALSIWWHGRQMENALADAPSYREYFLNFRIAVGLISTEMTEVLAEAGPKRPFTHVVFAVTAGAYATPALLMGGELRRTSEGHLVVDVPYHGLLLMIHRYPIRWMTIILHDIFLARNGTSLREIIICHRHTLRELRQVRVYENGTRPPLEATF